MLVSGVLLWLAWCSSVHSDKLEQILDIENGISSLPNSSHCHDSTNVWTNKSEKSCGRNATTEEHILSTGRFDVFDLWKRFPLAIMQNSTTIGENCRREYQRYLLGLERNDMSALKMFDANAKFPSGVLRGNVNQYGDFDECLSIEEGQYCLAEIDLTPIWSETQSSLKQLVHSHFAIQETFNDPGHRLPGFTMIRWGFCIPRACTHKDLENAIQEYLQTPARIRPQMCQKSVIKPKSYSRGEIIARLFFGSVFLFVFLSTMVVKYWPEVENRSDRITQIFLAFSLQRNWKQLVSLKDKNKEIEGVHGVRALSALALIMSHKAVALLYNPYINRTEMAESLGEAWCVMGRAAIIYTDSFMLLSGLLNANALFGDLAKDNSMKFKDKLITRIFRISPNIIAVILFCTYILPSMGSGPLWPLVVNHHSELCKSFMWRNMLYIHNYYGFENMCLTHTHQVGIDMQLFLFTPLIVFLMWHLRKIGLIVLGALATISTLLRIWVTWAYDISHFVHFGIPISRMFNTANLSYILPTHRATVYLIGVYLAYALKFTGKAPDFFKRNQQNFWILCFVLGLSAMIGPFHMAKVDYEFNKFDAVIFGAFSPIVWGAAVAWAIYAVNKGLGGAVGKLLVWNKFQYFSKISYAVYLVQFPVFFYHVGKRRYAEQYSSNMILELPDTLFIIAVATALTLMIELPFQRIRRVIFS